MFSGLTQVSLPTEHGLSFQELTSVVINQNRPTLALVIHDQHTIVLGLWVAYLELLGVSLLSLVLEWPLQGLGAGVVELYFPIGLGYTRLVRLRLLLGLLGYLWLLGREGLDRFVGLLLLPRYGLAAAGETNARLLTIAGCSE